MPRRQLPVSSFGSEILSALLRAAKPPGIRVPFESLDIAMRFRQRLYALRSAMTREKHPSLPIAMSVRIYVEKEPPAIRLAPADIEFADALSKAGVAPTPPHPETIPLSPAEFNNKFDALIRELADDDGLDGATGEDEKRA